MTRTGREAFREIQSRAKNEARGNTQLVLEQFVHERFLARLATSPFADRIVLKGGMLLAVMDLRRATRDADLMIRGITLDAEELRPILAEILAIDLEDGVEFDAEVIASEEIREDSDYAGLRFKVDARVGGAKVQLKLDVSAGDPVAPIQVQMPTLLGDEPIGLLAYPVEAVIAEKVETMMARGDANTRMRDFSDVCLISRRHEIDANDLRKALLATVAYRNSELIPLRNALTRLAKIQQVGWARFRMAAQLDEQLPADFSEVVEEVQAFVDPVVRQTSKGSRWSPSRRTWGE